MQRRRIYSIYQKGLFCNHKNKEVHKIQKAYQLQI